MRTVVKALAFSSVLAITFMQPGANAALAPDLPTDIQNRRETSAIDEIVAPFHGVNVILSSAAIDFAKAFVLDTPAWPIIMPDLTLASLGQQPEETLAAPVEVTPPSVRPAPRAMRPAAPRLDQVKFAGPTMPPFAHVKFCLANPAECREPTRKVVFRGGPVKLTDARRRELQNLNLEVNRSIIATPATDETPSTEKWLISPQYGDCNDYAVTKRSKLIAKGWPARSLLLAEVVVPSGEHHLIVVVRTDKGDLVLDNLNSNLRSWSKTNYDWIRIASPENPKYWSKVAPRSTTVASIGRRDSGRL